MAPPVRPCAVGRDRAAAEQLRDARNVDAKCHAVPSQCRLPALCPMPTTSVRPRRGHRVQGVAPARNEDLWTTTCRRSARSRRRCSPRRCRSTRWRSRPTGRRMGLGTLIQLVPSKCRKNDVHLAHTSSSETAAMLGQGPDVRDSDDAPGRAVEALDELDMRSALIRPPKMRSTPTRPRRLSAHSWSRPRTDPGRSTRWRRPSARSAGRAGLVLSPTAQSVLGGGRRDRAQLAVEREPVHRRGLLLPHRPVEMFRQPERRPPHGLGVAEVPVRRRPTWPRGRSGSYSFPRAVWTPPTRTRRPSAGRCPRPRGPGSDGSIVTTSIGAEGRDRVASQMPCRSSAGGCCPTWSRRSSPRPRRRRSSSRPRPSGRSRRRGSASFRSSSAHRPSAAPASIGSLPHSRRPTRRRRRSP